MEWLGGFATDPVDVQYENGLLRQQDEAEACVPLAVMSVIWYYLSNGSLNANGFEQSRI